MSRVEGLASSVSISLAMTLPECAAEHLANVALRMGKRPSGMAAALESHEISPVEVEDETASQCILSLTLGQTG